jgi:hypothetical protein
MSLRNEGVHLWWLPTGETTDPCKVLDLTGRKSRKGIPDDVILGGSVTLLKWIYEVSAVCEDQSRWMKIVPVPFLVAET